ncbi:MAG TPA: thiamine phosphate synthase [Alloacidobacterium sp.]|jgi:thiamine-phosphate pyrophosphorylase|nr:thiamine phosphate synthase [Alloacidobacterium sp.]
MQLYAITGRTLFPSLDDLLNQAAQWASFGVDFIQVREKDLRTDELAALTRKIVDAVRSTNGQTRVLLNGPAEIAIATGCDGIHLTSNQPESVIEAAKAAMSRSTADPVITISCHTIQEIERARNGGATLALFAPVFEKRSAEAIIPGQGLDALAAACRAATPMPVFALGGVTTENAKDCITAGAAGIAAVRLFTSGNWLNLL